LEISSAAAAPAAPSQVPFLPQAPALTHRLEAVAVPLQAGLPAAALVAGLPAAALVAVPGAAAPRLLTKVPRPRVARPHPGHPSLMLPGPAGRVPLLRYPFRACQFNQDTLHSYLLQTHHCYTQQVEITYSSSVRIT
jgi:hypothetical protein